MFAEIAGDRPRQPAYEIILMLWRVSWALAQISCLPVAMGILTLTCRFIFCFSLIFFSFLIPPLPLPFFLSPANLWIWRTAGPGKVKRKTTLQLVVSPMSAMCNEWTQERVSDWLIMGDDWGRTPWNVIKSYTGVRSLAGSSPFQASSRGSLRPRPQCQLRGRLCAEVGINMLAELWRHGSVSLKECFFWGWVRVQHSQSQGQVHDFWPQTVLGVRTVLKDPRILNMNTSNQTWPWVQFS